MADAAALFELGERLLAELRAIRHELAAQRGATALRAEDAKPLRTFVLAATRGFGARSWTTRELFGWCIEGNTPDRVAVTRSIEAVVLLDAPRAAATFGTWLRRCRGQTVDGLVLERVGNESNGAIWQIVRGT